MSLRSFFVVLMLVPVAAWADIRGVDLYARGDFEKALPVLQAEMENPSRSDKERARARIYLAASMYALGMMEGATKQLEELARLHPEQRVDPNRFPPDFVALADFARKTVETERLREKTRAEEAEQERLLAERRRREAEATPREPEGQVEDSGEEPQAEASFRVRPEVFGYVDAVGRSRGFGLGATVGYGGLEAGVRVLPGPDGRWGLGAEVGYVFGSGIFQPRVALRGTNVLGVGLGGGGAVGARLTLLPQLTLMADLGFEGFNVSDKQRYRGAVLVASAGVGFNLF
ncbi:hypothetical protein [Archangium sp.]|uniref:tetratricopeptide repeat protein n=1 Tax=Archangium sp. TaxID=1872627 RepID=UPI00286BD2F8|nr:hypothetical protein [Archangium sp.]